MPPINTSLTLPALLRWTPTGRAIVFVLSATSIWSLLAEFYKLCSMRTFTFSILIPSMLILLTMAVVDRTMGDGKLWRAMWIGAIGGLLAAIAYDIYRLPFVIAAIDKIGPTWLRLPLYKVFPRFGALILNQPFAATTTDSQFPLATHVVGWSYHFSNGITFGVMYLALIGDAARRSWLWAVALAVVLEVAMLLTPYTSFFGIALTTKFVVATLTAHLIFGTTFGLYARGKARSMTTRYEYDVPPSGVIA